MDQIAITLKLSRREFQLVLETLRRDLAYLANMRMSLMAGDLEDDPPGSVPEDISGTNLAVLAFCEQLAKKLKDQ